jgi:hypothetical protein
MAVSDPSAHPNSAELGLSWMGGFATLGLTPVETDPDYLYSILQR